MDRLVSAHYALRAIFQIYGSRVGNLLARLTPEEVTARAELMAIAAMIRATMHSDPDVLCLTDARLHAGPDAANLTWNGVSISVRYDREQGWVCLSIPAGLGPRARLFKPAVGFSTREEAADLAADCVLHLLRHASNAR